MESTIEPGRWPTLFIPHGGGPCFFVSGSGIWAPDVWRTMASYLSGIDAGLGARPNAVLVISSHWEERRSTVNVAAHPTLLYDYAGFPAETYALTYPVNGAPDLARDVRALLDAAGIASETEAHRGLDHGVFVPFKLIYPHADVPIVELSLQRDLDARDHLAIGRALAPLRDRGVLIVGSGMSYHNLADLMSGRGTAEADGFDDWLGEAVLDRRGRDDRLAQWATAPHARSAHPEPEHLLPLMVAAGAASGEPATVAYHDRVFGKPISAFRFG